jgi:hypothetical protein
MTNDYHDQSWSWKPSPEVTEAIARGDRALKAYYQNVSKEYEESTRIGEVMDLEAKVRSFESVMK